MDFVDLFREATRGSGPGDSGYDPYPCQVEFASRTELARLLNLPTGAGKTATTGLGWLYRRRFHPDDSVRQATPRRLVYCLPMRVLVEQTQRALSQWLERLGLLAEEPGDESPVGGWAADQAANDTAQPARIAVSVLMGGADVDRWFLHPEREAILIGTQDMLLSRALNRGYAASRFHWPIDFGLLNSDCLWVFDEPQLMGSGVSTSAQLAGLRESLQTIGDCPSVWMSATLEPEWLQTVDAVDSGMTGNSPPLELGEYATGNDLDPARPLHRRMTADKTLSALNVESSSDMKAVAKAVLDAHEAGSQTLVIVNTVARAKAVWTAIEKSKKREKKEHLTTLLAHSRFRDAERQQLNASLQNDQATEDRIIVATQVVEAGVDLSARTLITELAPWASLVQRMGRCNRTGDDGPGRVLWVDVPDRLAKNDPYDTGDKATARDLLNKLEGKSVSPLALTEFKQAEDIRLRFEHRHVLRRRDLLDLFDTAPDLSGNDIDVQRFVRGDDPDIDVQVFWRDWPLGEIQKQPAPARRELCRVSIGAFRDFFKKQKKECFVWDHIDGEWRVVRDVGELRPGLTIMLPAEAGGYSEQLGWEAGSKDRVTPLPPADPKVNAEEEATESDPQSSSSLPLTIAAHTQHVCDELEDLLKPLTSLLKASLQEPAADWPDSLRQAARWHDVGKAHPAFQHGMKNANEVLKSGDFAAQLWAKSGTDTPLRHGRKHFRHELASALAVLQREFPFAVAYLIAAHHGRVRLSIRAMPDEPDETVPSRVEGDSLPSDETLFALGVYDDDGLPEVDLGGQTVSPALSLDLSPMQLGGETSWTARALDLLEQLGPFRLAYLEAVLRVADCRASRKESTPDATTGSSNTGAAENE